MLALILVALLAQSPADASVKIHHKKSHRRHHKPATVPNNRVNPAYVPNMPYYPPMNPYTYPLPHAGVADYTTCTCPTWGHLICDPATKLCTIKCGTQTLCQGQCASQNAKVGLTGENIHRKILVAIYFQCVPYGLQEKIMVPQCVLACDYSNKMPEEEPPTVITSEPPTNETSEPPTTVTSEVPTTESSEPPTTVTSELPTTTSTQGRHCKG